MLVEETLKFIIDKQHKIMEELDLYIERLSDLEDLESDSSAKIEKVREIIDSVVDFHDYVSASDASELIDSTMICLGDLLHEEAVEILNNNTDDLVDESDANHDINSAIDDIMTEISFKEKINKNKLETLIDKNKKSIKYLNKISLLFMLCKTYKELKAETKGE